MKTRAKPAKRKLGTSYNQGHTDARTSFRRKLERDGSRITSPIVLKYIRILKGWLLTQDERANSRKGGAGRGRIQ